MSPTEASTSHPAASEPAAPGPGAPGAGPRRTDVAKAGRGPRRPHASWQRLGLALPLLGVLLFVLARGGERPEAEETAAPIAGPVAIPLPPAPHRDLLEEARGIYQLETEQATFSLELLTAGKFRFSSRMREQKPRTATGTWNLVGTRLTMVYQTVDGEPVDGMSVANNVHLGGSIEIRDTGLDFPVVLTKRTVIRQLR